MNKHKPLSPKDVVRINHPTFGPKTGVVNRICPTTSMVNVFPKGIDIGVWFNAEHLKRIGRTHE